MKSDTKKYVKIGVTVFLLFLAMFYWKPFVKIVKVAFKAATPLLIGCVIAYIVNILMSFYERHYFPKSNNEKLRKSSRPVCMVGAFLTLILILVLVLKLIVPELVSCIQLLFAEVPKMLRTLAGNLSRTGVIPENVEDFMRGMNWNDALKKLFAILSSGIGSTVNLAVGAVSTIAGSTMNFVIGAIFSIYLLAGKESLKAQAERILSSYVKPAWNEKLHYVLTITNDCFHRYIVGQCTEAVILGALCALGMFIFRFPYAVMTGAVIGVTALIPVAGAYIGGAVGFILILSVSPTKAVLFLVYLVILQQLEGNLIYPRVVGSSIGLPGLWVLATVTVGGGIMGIAGMLIGVPIAAALYQILRNDVHKKEKTVKA